MRRALQLLGLSGLLATGFATQAFAEETPTADEGHSPAEEAKPAQPELVAATAATAVAPVAMPKVGDMTAHGYFRGGFGANLGDKGRQVCFGLSTISGGLKSKYRLGNECEVWSELLLSTVMYVGKDGTVGTFYFMPVAFIPTTYVGYSPAATTSAQDQQGFPSTGATVAFPNVYADMKGIDWLFGGTAWVGSRYYKRESVYISDFFYWNPSGVGGGIEDFSLGKAFGLSSDMVRDLRLSYAAFAVDGQPGGKSYLPQVYALGIRNDVQLRGFRPWTGGELQVGFQYILDWSSNKDDSGNDAPTHGGWGATLQYVQEVLGGDNKLVFQYGRGGGTGFGTLARFYYPDFSIMQDTSEWRFRALDVLTIQPIDWFGAQVVGVYQRDDNGTGVSGSVEQWYSGGTRVSVAFAEHAKFLGEAGYDREFKSNGAPPLWLAKFTGALAINASKGFWSRPELRLYYTWATWSDAAGSAGVDSGQLYGLKGKYPDHLSGSIVGVQAEAIF